VISSSEEARRKSFQNWNSDRGVSETSADAGVSLYYIDPFADFVLAGSILKDVSEPAGVIMFQRLAFALGGKVSMILTAREFPTPGSTVRRLHHSKAVYVLFGDPAQKWLNRPDSNSPEESAYSLIVRAPDLNLLLSDNSLKRQLWADLKDHLHQV
jgi:hypothetical protein